MSVVGNKWNSLSDPAVSMWKKIDIKVKRNGMCGSAHGVSIEHQKRSLQICTISLVRPDAQTKTVGGNFLLILLRLSYDCIDELAGRQTKEIAIVSETESLCNRTGNNQHSDLFEYSLCVFSQ